VDDEIRGQVAGPDPEWVMAIEQRLSALHLQVEVGFTRLQGTLEVLAANRETMQAQAQRAQERADSAHVRLDALPKPETLEQAVARVEQTRTTLDRLVAGMAGAGLLGGGVGAAVSQFIFGG
jgi:hypothetical protein